MRKYSVIWGILFFVSCTNYKESKKCFKTEFTYFYEEPEVLMNKGGIKRISFLFYINRIEEKTEKENLKSLIINIPKNRTKFSLNDTSNLRCIYSYYSKNNNLKSELVKHGNGIIEGELLNKETWKIKIKFKEFDFDGLFFSKNTKYVNRIKID